MPARSPFAGGAERSPAPPAKDAKYGHLLGGHVAGNGAGIVVDGEITPLAGEPPVAQTHGWGIVLRK
jgi:hypothetical protein